VKPAARLLLGAICYVLNISAAETYTYWIQPCTAEVAKQSRCEPSDSELARWALDAWRRVTPDSLTFTPAPENRARLRVYWASERLQLYGEARPMMVEGKPGAAIFVNPDTAQLGPEIREAAAHDRLLRDSIVYLTCVHESGHALGLRHTAEFADIMYYFGFGGDIVEYFERYRRGLTGREDISKRSGIASHDERQLRQLLGAAK
jgi:hypothetical protein